MSNSDPKENAIATTVTEVAKSKAGEKLMDAVKGLIQLPHNIVDYIAGPKRIGEVASARAEGKLVEARADAEIERLRAETASFVLDREMHKTLNRQQILAEAQKALPPPDAPISDKPVSKDFIHSFFEEFDGISDPEVHKIAGRLLTGEVVRPGSFPRRTMRVLRDLDSADFAKFASLCRLCWYVGELVPLVYEPNDAFYHNHGINLRHLNELEALGLISFSSIGGFQRTGLPKKFAIFYGPNRVEIELPSEQGNFQIGRTLFTDAGTRLGALTEAKVIPEFLNYALDKMRALGYKADVVEQAPSG
jgi:hypothetical protein